MRRNVQERGFSTAGFHRRSGVPLYHSGGISGKVAYVSPGGAVAYDERTVLRIARIAQAERDAANPPNPHAKRGRGRLTQGQTAQLHAAGSLCKKPACSRLATKARNGLCRPCASEARRARQEQAEQEEQEEEQEEAEEQQEEEEEAEDDDDAVNEEEAEDDDVAVNEEEEEEEDDNDDEPAAKRQKAEADVGLH